MTPRHENDYSADGQRVFHASVGTVYTPTDQPAFDTTMGQQDFQIVRSSDMSIESRWDRGKELAEARCPGISFAVNLLRSWKYREPAMTIRFPDRHGSSLTVDDEGGP